MPHRETGQDCCDLFYENARIEMYSVDRAGALVPALVEGAPPAVVVEGDHPRITKVIVLFVCGKLDQRLTSLPGRALQIG